MNQATETRTVNAPIAALRDILLAAPKLPEWNPAFVRLTGASYAAEGSAYELETIRGLRGILTYTHVQERIIEFSWNIPMLTETGIWNLIEDGRGCTMVTHTVQRGGPLALVLAHTLQTLPRLRLDRLVERAQQLAVF